MARPAKATRKAETKGDGQAGESKTGYFRQLLKEKPRLLDGRSNHELIDRWRQDHPGEEFSDSVRAALQNAKSAERHIRRKKGRKKKAKQAQPQETTALALASHPLPKPAKAAHKLEALEEQIDDCLSLAKHLDREGLGEVIRLLRHARNAVVWKMGQ